MVTGRRAFVRGGRSWALVVMLLGSPAVAGAACDDILPAAPSTPGNVRPIEARDLARLRDIGQPDGSILGRPSPIAISPDGSRMAFVITRGDPDTNRQCRALVTMDIRPGAKAKIIDQGGAFIKSTGAYRGLVATVGYPSLVIPQWRPDGDAVAYLRRENGITQIWMAQADGSGARPLTRSEVDIEAFVWTAAGKQIVFATRPGRMAEQRATQHEARDGYLYDERFVPNAGAAPQSNATIARKSYVLSLDTGRITDATDAERAMIADDEDAASARVAHAPDGRRAGTDPGPAPLSPARIWAEDRSRTRMLCSAEACSGSITGLWWSTDGEAIVYLRREGWAKEEIALYRWRPGSGAPRRISTRADVLDGCAPAKADLICTRESASEPRRLVRLDPATGRTTTLFDPNPEFASLRLGKVERVHWRNALGLEVRGDLALPPDYRPGDRLPLIVTQYFSNGFLRGGTGDEYPIHVFAARGFAVLSLERPVFYAATVPGLKTFEDVNAANARGWSERESLFSAMVAGIDMLIARGIADPQRIGLTGLSDGATSVAFALIHSRRFAAASISTCCIGPWTTMSIGGIAYADRMRRLGYPRASDHDTRFWQPVSLATNAASIDTPILMQLADDEYLLALETFTALREQGKPVEMFVFPQEHHIKWQPAHRLAIYERNLDWFDFWLRGVETGDRSEITRWRAMRARRSVMRPLQDHAPSQASTSTSRMMRR